MYSPLRIAKAWNQSNRTKFLLQKIQCMPSVKKIVGHLSKPEIAIVETTLFLLYLRKKTETNLQLKRILIQNSFSSIKRLNFKKPNSNKIVNNYMFSWMLLHIYSYYMRGKINQILKSKKMFLTNKAVRDWKKSSLPDRNSSEKEVITTFIWVLPFFFYCPKSKI